MNRRFSGIMRYEATGPRPLRAKRRKKMPLIFMITAIIIDTRGCAAVAHDITRVAQRVFSPCCRDLKYAAWSSRGGLRLPRFIDAAMIFHATPRSTTPSRKPRLRYRHKAASTIAEQLAPSPGVNSFRLTVSFATGPASRCLGHDISLYSGFPAHVHYFRNIL